jgi:hypothetical protein
VTTQTARRQSATADSQSPKAPKPFRGQLGPEAIGDILKSNRTNASKARAAFLKSHLHYTACSVAGCQGLVGPMYQRTTPDGRKYGFCPRRRVHAQLMPEVFTSN